MTDPRRLIDDPNVPASMREALAGERRAKALLDLDAGWTKLRVAAAAMTASIPVHAVPAPLAATENLAEPEAAIRAGAPDSLRIGVGVSLLAILGLGWMIASAPSRHEMHRNELAARPTPSIATASPAPEEATAAPKEDDAVVSLSLPVNALPRAPITTPGVTTAGSRPRAPEKAALDDDALREELAQMRDIRARLDPDPASALALAEDGQRRFSNGHLVVEREGLSVIALARLGRRDDARAKAKAFVSRYPRSTLVARIEAELGALR